jgi:hypothetical protein
MADWSVILHASAVLREHDLTEHQGRLAQALERGAALDACRAGAILGEAVRALLARRLDAVARQSAGHDAVWADIAALRAARQALDGLACDRLLAESASASVSQPAMAAWRMAWEVTLQRESEALLTDPVLAAQPALLDQLRGILDPRVRRLFVLGNVKRGKSTLINALLGARLLPARATPTTVVQCMLRHADTLQITARFGDGRPSAALSPAELEDHIAYRPAPGVNPMTAVEIELPWLLLQAGLQVIDTPGLNESSERTASILAAINAADILIYVLSATEPLSADELETIDRLWRDGHRTILFVVSYADRVEPEDLPALRERFVRLLGAFGPPAGPLPLFLVAARPALLAQGHGDAAALAASGLPALQAALERLAEPLEIAPLRRARLRRLCDAARTAEAEAAATVERAFAALARAEDDMRLLAARASAAERAQAIAERNAAHERAAALLATYRAGAGWAIKAAEPATSTNRPSSLRSAAAELRAAQSALDAAARQGEDIRAAARDALADAARLDATILRLQGALLEG